LPLLAPQPAHFVSDFAPMASRTVSKRIAFILPQREIARLEERVCAVLINAVLCIKHTSV